MYTRWHNWWKKNEILYSICTKNMNENNNNSFFCKKLFCKTLFSNSIMKVNFAERSLDLQSTVTFPLNFSLVDV